MDYARGKKNYGYCILSGVFFSARLHLEIQFYRPLFVKMLKKFHHITALFYISTYNRIQCLFEPHAY